MAGLVAGSSSAKMQASVLSRLLSCDLIFQNSTTYFLAGIAGRAARVNKLNMTPAQLLAGDTSPALLARVRLWMWMCFVDAHGCMQNGRAASIDITEALKVTKTFASLSDAPSECLRN